MAFKKTLLAAGAAVGILAGASSVASAGQPTVEVLHWWTSGGEAKALKALKDDFTAHDGKWVDSPVAGGGGDAAMTVLRARVLAGDPPTAVQLKGPAIQEWAAQGVVANLDDVAKAEGWDKVIPPMLQKIVKYKGDYVAVPVNIHRVNWIWANPKLLAKVGAKIPTTWAEFNAVADKLKAKGIIPLAHGGQPWQDATIFETVVMGIGGADFYRKALVELDDNALKSDTMIKVFDQMRKIRGDVDPDFSGRDWNLATNMVMNGKAAMQIMGDWAKGEFLAAGKVPGKDFLCAPTPTKGGAFILNSDSLVMFKVKGKDKIEGQKLLAKLILGKKFQETFNLYKGSIPARVDVPMGKFDSCALKSLADLKSAMKAGTLVPSMAHGIALPGNLSGAITDVVTAHFNSNMSSKEAVKRLVEAVDLAKN